MTINPKVGMWFSIVLAVIGGLSSAGTEFTTIFGEHVANQILAADALLLSVGTAVNAVLHMIPSQPGPAAASEFPLGPKPPVKP
jgi:hypothetical protein